MSYMYLHKGNKEIIKILHEFGAPLNHQSNKGLTPLHYAAKGARGDCVKYLIDHGADLFIATHKGQLPIDVAEGGEVQRDLKWNMDPKVGMILGLLWCFFGC